MPNVICIRNDEHSDHFTNTMKYTQNTAITSERNSRLYQCEWANVKVTQTEIRIVTKHTPERSILQCTNIHPSILKSLHCMSMLRSILI